jgi:hypothetical protein
VNPGEETTRIRWEPTKYGGWTGHVGTIEQFVFQVWKPAKDKPWQLESNLPGHFGYISTSADPDKLKGRAEEWLSEFVSSLGAVFPAPAPARGRPRDLAALASILLPEPPPEET